MWQAAAIVVHHGRVIGCIDDGDNSIRDIVPPGVAPFRGKAQTQRLGGTVPLAALHSDDQQASVAIDGADAELLAQLRVVAESVDDERRINPVRLSRLTRRERGEQDAKGEDGG